MFSASSWYHFLHFGLFPVDGMVGLLYMYSNAILCVPSVDSLSVFRKSDFAVQSRIAVHVQQSQQS